MTNGKIFISNDQDNYVSEEYNDVILEDGLPQATIVDDYFSNEPQVVPAVSVIIPAIHYQERTPFCIQDLPILRFCLRNLPLSVTMIAVLTIIILITTGSCSVTSCWRS